MNRSSPPAPHALPPQGLLTSGQRSLLWAIAAISVFTNLLMLTGPLFMLQVYDRVLASRSEATLIVLLSLVAFLYAIMGLLDHARARIAARLGAQLQYGLDRGVFEFALRSARARQGDPADAARAPQDLSYLQQISGSPIFMALFDFPWVPLFIGVIALLHPLLGLTALGCALLLAAIGIVGQRKSQTLASAGQQALQQADALARHIAGQSPVMRALGMERNALTRWRTQRQTALQGTVAAQDYSGRFTAAVRTLRLFMQSALLAAGAALVLSGEITPGAMIAATIILGRALAPLDQLISGGSQLLAALAALKRVRHWLQQTSTEAHTPISLADPLGGLRLEQVFVPARAARVRNAAALRNINFAVDSGQALGVIGPSGSGKSMLAAALTGQLQASAGDILLGATRLDQIAPPQLGKLVGYLPQYARLYEGSLRDNIARFDPDATDALVIAAARDAGAHEMILSLPDAYDTMIAPDGSGLSGGQAQLVALARALFGAPQLLVLDAPDTYLDEPGQRALKLAIRKAKARGAAVILMAYRPPEIAECDLLVKLDKGRIVASGPTDSVLREVTCNVSGHAQPKLQPSVPRMPQIYPWEIHSSGSRP